MLTRYSEPWFRILYSPDGAGGSGAAGGTGGSGTGDGGAAGATGNAGGSGGAQPATQPTMQGKVFTEEYVRALREESAGHRTRAKALEAAARTALGLADGADLPQDLAAALAGLKAAGQAEAEKKVNTAKAFLVKGFFAAAAAGKVADVEDAYKLADLSGVEVDLEKGEITVKGKDGKVLADKEGSPLTGQAALAALVDELVKAKPYLAAKGAGPSQVGGTAPAGGGTGENDPKATAKAIAEERAKARSITGSSFWGRKKE